MRDMLEARKRGDFAFRDKDFKTAIDCYSQVCFVFQVFCSLAGNMPLYVSNTVIQIANMHGHYMSGL